VASPDHPKADRSGLFREPGFRLLLAGQALSQLGFQFSTLAMPVLAVVLLHATEEQMGYLNAADFAAFLVVGLLAGGWVDRWRKRRVMLAADLVRATAVLVIPILWATGSLAIWHLYLIGAVIGVATVFFDVSYQSYLPILLPGRLVGPGNGVLEGTSQVARLAGPGIAGALLAVLAAPLLLVANAVGFLISACCLAFIRDQERPQAKHERRRLLTEIAEGVRFVAGEPLLRLLVITVALANIGSTIMFTVFPILVLRDLALPPQLLGVILTFGAIGGIAGSFAAPRVSDGIGQGPTLRLTLVLSAFGVVLLPYAAHVPSVALALLCLGEALMSFSVVMFNVVQVTTRQRLCPPRLLGRMNASIRFVVWGVMPLAALASGALGGWLGTLATVWIGASVIIVGVLPMLLSRYGSMHELPTAAESLPAE